MTLLGLLISLAVAAAEETPQALGFVNVQTRIPDVRVEMRYNTDWNFLGRKVKGYKANHCWLTSPAAKALAEVQKEVKRQGYSLLMLDCYRPQRAVDEFVAWVNEPRDSKMKVFFYPEEPKEELINRGYIDSQSGHSRGSVVDLTLVRADLHGAKALQFKEKTKDCRDTKGIQTTGQLDMGTAYDCFSELSHTDSDKVSPEARKNRMILKAAMEKHGFSNYHKEWWHYVLKHEPYKDRYFNFEVK